MMSMGRDHIEIVSIPARLLSPSFPDKPWLQPDIDPADGVLSNVWNFLSVMNVFHKLPSDHVL